MDKTPDDDRTLAAGGSGFARTVQDAQVSAGVAAESGDRLAIGTRLGEFEVTGLVGEGGFSIVYLAWDHSLERKVALKEYMPSSLATRRGRSQVHARSERHRETFDAGLKSFVNEGKLLAQFDHPALVKVYRFWEANGTAYMVMPLYEGVTLKDTVRAMPEPPGEAWLVRLLEPLTEALTAIHREQCFHRDIAPDNVLLLAQGGKPLLLDFGAARRVIGDKTQALTVILKPGYAPIEQYAEDLAMKQGPWTDVYALAAVVYWAITGKTPPVAVGRMINDGYVPLTQCAAGRYGTSFLTAVDRALAVLPDKRTRSIEQFRSELGLNPGRASHADERTVLWGAGAAVAHTPTAHTPSATAPAPAPRPQATALPPPPTVASGRAAPVSAPRRSLLAWGAFGGTGVALAAGAVWWALRTPSPAPIAPTSAAITSPPASAPPPMETPAAPPAPAPAPAASAAPRSAQDALDQWLATRDMTIEVTASAQADAPGLAKSMLRLFYRASEAGHAYVLGIVPGTNQLTLFHPPVGTPARRAVNTGSIDVPASAFEVSGSKLLLVIARERHEPQTAGWVARERFRVRTFGTGLGPDEAVALLGAPQCARGAVRCDGGFGVTEVMQMTNVISAPPPAPPTGSAPPDDTPKSPANQPPSSPDARSGGSSTAGKPASKRTAGDAQECAQILQRVSLGENSPELIERMKTLRCN
jgi:hypothetical protein